MKTPNEWQSFSQKKDIEEIKEGIINLNNNQNTFMRKSLISVILTTISAVIAGITLTFLDKSTSTILILCAAIILLAIAPFLKSICLFICKGNQPIPKDLGKIIDLFDNETIYYVMMSKSFLEYISNDLSETENELYKIEAKYYLDKAVSQLALIQGEQFACDTEISKLMYNVNALNKNKYISYGRMNLTLKLISEITKMIDDKIFTDHIFEEVNNILNTWTTDKSKFVFEL